MSSRIVLIAILSATAALAQFRAGIQGTVSDASGAVVPGVTVTLTSNETQKKQTATTSGEGFYRFNGLAPGTYTVSATKQEFQTTSAENVRITGDDVQGVNLTIQPGTMTQSVTVNADLGNALETENANVDTQLTTQAVRDLPQFGRDPYNLLRLAPGVFGEGSRSGGGQAVALPNSNGPGGSNSSIFQTENQVPIVANGQRLSQNNYQLDGVSVNSLTWGGAAVLTPNQESVKSIQVSSSEYTAEAGRNAGAQIDVVSQNGTNQFHGSGVFKYNDPIFNAYNKFGGPNHAPFIRVNDYQRQFAASVGGPILKNHLFFFFSYEGLRDNSTNYTTEYVETPQYRQQVLSLRPNSLLAKVFSNPGIAPRVVAYIPTTCPAGFRSGTCQVVNGGLDIGSITGAKGSYVDNGANAAGSGLDGVPDIAFAQVALPQHTEGNQYNGRVDFNATPNDTIAVSTYFTKLNTLGSDAGGGSRPLGDIANSPLNTAITLTYNRIVSASVLNEARFNLTRFASNQVAAASGTNFGIPRLEVEGLPLPDRIRFGAPQSESTPAIFAQNQYEFRDNISKVIGNHALRFGGQFRWEQDNNSLVGGARPIYSFQGLWNLANDTPVYEGINANPVTGAPADAQRYFRSKDFALYGQDDWKIRPGLTLSLGLRWEYFSPITEKRNRLTNFLFASPGTLVGGRVATVSQLYKPDYKDFAPRFGLAWNPQRFNKLVLRTGFGIYYTRVPDVLFANTRGNPPYFARYGLCCGTVGSPFANGQILYALGASNSIYSYPANPAIAVGIDPVAGGVLNRTVEVWGAQQNFPTGYAYVYSFGLEYALPFNVVASAGFQGSTDHHLIRIVNQNFLYPNASNAEFGPIYFPQPDVNSNYNALNVGLSRRFTSGVGLQFKYRWSKSMDELSGEGPGGNTNQTYPQNLHSEWGPSDFDTKHYVVLAGQYEFPWFKKQQGFVGKVLGGFSLSGVMTYHTGFPYTVKIGQSVSTPGGPSLGPIRPTRYYGNQVYSNSNDALINGTNWTGGGAKYFDITDTGYPGVGRNSFRGPNYFGTDLTVIKQIKFPENWRMGSAAMLDLRGNIFNLFNTLNLTPIGYFDSTAFADSPQFGRATQPGLAGRVVEFQVRFSF